MTGPGVAFSIDRGAEFTIIALGIHYHTEGEEMNCFLKTGLTISILGVHMFLGIIKYY